MVKLHSWILTFDWSLLFITALKLQFFSSTNQYPISPPLPHLTMVLNKVADSESNSGLHMRLISAAFVSTSYWVFNDPLSRKKPHVHHLYVYSLISAIHGRASGTYHCCLQNRTTLSMLWNGPFTVTGNESMLPMIYDYAYYWLHKSDIYMP